MTTQALNTAITGVVIIKTLETLTPRKAAKMPKKLSDGRVLYEVFVEKGVKTKKLFTYAKSPTQATRFVEFKNRGWKAYNVRKHR